MSLKVGKIAGIDIRLHYSWFVIFVLIAWSLAVGYLPDAYPNQSQGFYWTVGLVSSAFLFISVLVHEVFHSIVARRNNISVRGITLHFFGGVSEISEEVSSPSVELKMAAAGPLTSLVIGVVFLGLWLLIPSGFAIGVRATLQYAAYINIVLAFFNLIPAFPMDGGRVLRALFWMRSGSLLASTRRATQFSHFFSYLLMALGMFSFVFVSVFNGLWLLIIALFIKNSADASLNETMMVEALRNVRVEDIMTREVHTVEPDIAIQQLVDEHFIKYKHGGFPVLSGDRLVGIVTDQDVRQVPREQWGSAKVGDVMKPAVDLVTIKPDDTASDALLQMSKHDVGRLPVLDGGRLVGIITRSDITKTIRSKLQFRS